MFGLITIGLTMLIGTLGLLLTLGPFVTECMACGIVTVTGCVRTSPPFLKPEAKTPKLV